MLETDNQSAKQSVGEEFAAVVYTNGQNFISDDFTIMWPPEILIEDGQIFTLKYSGFMGKISEAQLDLSVRSSRQVGDPLQFHADGHDGGHLSVHLFVSLCLHHVSWLMSSVRFLQQVGPDC